VSRAGDNGGGGWPSDGGSSDDLPDLPAEWGLIVVPDDLSELADEVDAVRAELRLSQPQTRWQRFAGRAAPRRLRRIGNALLRAPVLIIAMAVLVTVASLFASAWPGPARTPATQRTADTTDEPAAETVPALELIGPDGRTVALRGRLPAVVLLTDGCDCAQLVADTVAAVRPEITVVTVSAGQPSPGTVPATGAAPQAQGKTVRMLWDSTDQLRRELKLGPPDGTAAAILVDRDGGIVRSLPRTASVETLRPDLARL
jgi:hypothetical protein